MFFTILFSLPMSILIGVQTTNYLKGVTTSERFGRHNRADSELSENSTNNLDFNA